MVMVVSSPLLPRAGVRQLEVGHDEVLVVLDIFRLNAVLPTLYAGTWDRERFIKQQLELSSALTFQLWPVLTTLGTVSLNGPGGHHYHHYPQLPHHLPGV